MLAGVQKERTKRHHHKTRTGCSTCKKRHFKCDEKETFMFEMYYRWQRLRVQRPINQEVPSTPSDQSQQSITPSPQAPESHITLDPQEQRALLFFQERTGPSLTGFTSYTEIFWVSLIPQLCLSEVAVHHLVIALATKHEAVVTGTIQSEEKSLYWTKQHSLALNALTDVENPPSAEVLLVSCIVFIAFERLQDPTGLEEGYLNYVVSGLKILRERSDCKPKQELEDFNLIDSFIEPMFFQIELLFCMFCQPDRLVASSARQYQVPCPDIPHKFSSLESARDLMFQICAWRYTLAHGGRPWSNTSAAFLEIKFLMKKWHDSLDVYLAELPENEEKETSRAYALRQQVQLLVGAMLYSGRDDVSPYCCSRPEVVDLSIPSKILIFIRIRGDRKINLTGINTGRPALLKDSGLWLWPHAKRIAVHGGEDMVSLEFSSSEAMTLATPSRASQSE